MNHLMDHVASRQACPMMSLLNIQHINCALVGTHMNNTSAVVK